MRTLWAVIAVAIIGGGIYFATINKSSVSTETLQQNENGRYRQSFTETTSLASIVNAGGSYTCTTYIEITGATTDGTFYIANKKMRGDFSSTVSGMGSVIKSHMISDGAYIYSWSDVVAKGVKVKVVTTLAKDDSPGFDYNKQYNYDCKAWVADESKFVIPTNITFIEVK